MKKPKLTAEDWFLIGCIIFIVIMVTCLIINGDKPVPNQTMYDQWLTRN